MSDQSITATELWHLAVDETRLFTMDFTPLLASGETLNSVTGTSGGVTLGVTTTAGSAITVATPAINTDAITVSDGDTIAIGKAVQVRLTEVSATAGASYEVTFWATTTAANRLTQVATLKVVD